MHTRRCGKYELELPVLGMGCFAYGGGDYWGAQSQGDVNEVVRHAVDQGCNFFDTAEMYNQGASESALGEALKAVPHSNLHCWKVFRDWKCHPHFRGYYSPSI